MIQFTTPPAVPNGEAWQLHQPNQPPLCVYQLDWQIPAASTPAAPLYSYLAAPAGASVIAPPGGLVVGPFAAMAACAQSGFYMYIVECTPGVVNGPGTPFVYDDCASALSPAAGAVVAAGTPTTNFVIAFVGRTEEQLAEQYRQHRKEINGVNARSPQGVTWRAWFETRRSFFVGFPAADSLATALQMMLVRPYLPTNANGFKFPLNDVSSWPGRIAPSTASFRASLASPSLIHARELINAACGQATPLVYTAMATEAISIAFPGGGAPFPAWICTGGGAVPPLVFPPLVEGAPSPGWTGLNSVGAPTFAGAAIPLPATFAFDPLPGMASPPHKATMTATEWRAIVYGALLTLEGTRQMIGAAII